MQKERHGLREENPLETSAWKKIGKDWTYERRKRVLGTESGPGE